MQEFIRFQLAVGQRYAEMSGPGGESVVADCPYPCPPKNRCDV